MYERDEATSLNLIRTVVKHSVPQIREALGAVNVSGLREAIADRPELFRSIISFLKKTLVMVDNVDDFAGGQAGRNEGAKTLSRTLGEMVGDPEPMVSKGRRDELLNQFHKVRLLSDEQHAKAIGHVSRGHGFKVHDEVIMMDISEAGTPVKRKGVIRSISYIADGCGKNDYALIRWELDNWSAEPLSFLQVPDA